MEAVGIKTGNAEAITTLGTRDNRWSCWKPKPMSCTREIRARTAIAKEAFNGKKRLLRDKINKNLKKRLAKCYVWSVALYGADTVSYTHLVLNTLIIEFVIVLNWV